MRRNYQGIHKSLDLLDSEAEDGSVSSWLFQHLVDVRKNFVGHAPIPYFSNSPYFFLLKMCTFSCDSHHVGPRWRNLSNPVVPMHTKAIAVEDIHRRRLVLTGRNKWGCSHFKRPLLRCEGIDFVLFCPVWQLSLGGLLLSEEETEGVLICGRGKAEAELGGVQGEETGVRVYWMGIDFQLREWESCGQYHVLWDCIRAAGAGVEEGPVSSSIRAQVGVYSSVPQFCW